MTTQQERTLIWWGIIIGLICFWALIIMLLWPNSAKSDEPYNNLWMGPPPSSDNACCREPLRVIVTEPNELERKIMRLNPNWTGFNGRNGNVGRYHRCCRECR